MNHICIGVASFRTKHANGRTRLCIRILMYDSGYVSLEHLLLWRHPSQRDPASVWALRLSSQSNPGQVNVKDIYFAAVASGMYIGVSLEPAPPSDP